MPHGSILGGLGGLGRATENATGSEGGDRDMFTEQRAHAWTGSNLVDGEFTELFYFTIPAQTGYVWGFGEPTPGKKDNQGRLYFDPQGATPADTVGRLRLESRNAVGKDIEDHGTFHTSELRMNLTDKTTWMHLPERDMQIVGEDSQLVGQFEYDAASSTDSTVNQANSTLRASMTEFTGL